VLRVPVWPTAVLLALVPALRQRLASDRSVDPKPVPLVLPAPVLPLRQRLASDRSVDPRPAPLVLQQPVLLALLPALPLVLQLLVLRLL
jgi:hypothetical protein